MNYTRITCDLVLNEEYIFYKLAIDGVCQFDEFLHEIDRNVNAKKNLTGIVAVMEHFSAKIMLPKSKFRYVHIKGRNDIYEFKKNDIRVYVIVGKEDITIALGGFKKNQDSDISRLERNLKNYPK